MYHVMSTCRPSLGAALNLPIDLLSFVLLYFTRVGPIRLDGVEFLGILRNAFQSD